jgi:hypothetical protein
MYDRGRLPRVDLPVAGLRLAGDAHAVRAHPRQHDCLGELRLWECGKSWRIRQRVRTAENAAHDGLLWEVSGAPFFKDDEWRPVPHRNHCAGNRVNEEIVAAGGGVLQVGIAVCVCRARCVLQEELVVQNLSTKYIRHRSVPT